MGKLRLREASGSAEVRSSAGWEPPARARHGPGPPGESSALPERSPGPGGRPCFWKRAPRTPASLEAPPARPAGIWRSVRTRTEGGGEARRGGPRRERRGLALQLCGSSPLLPDGRPPCPGVCRAGSACAGPGTQPRRSGQARARHAGLLGHPVTSKHPGLLAPTLTPHSGGRGNLEKQQRWLLPVKG